MSFNRLKADKIGNESLLHEDNTPLLDAMYLSISSEPNMESLMREPA
jgi:hypothetical protein